MDADSCKQVDKYFNMFRILPNNFDSMTEFSFPLFMDCWFWCAGPEIDDTVPQTEEQRLAPHTDSMNRFVINRHQGAINSIFLDNSVRKIGLKALWKQRWHRSWRMDWPLPDWPEWMQQFPDP